MEDERSIVECMYRFDKNIEKNRKNTDGLDTIVELPLPVSENLDESTERTEEILNKLVEQGKVGTYSGYNEQEEDINYKKFDIHIPISSKEEGFPIRLLFSDSKKPIIGPTATFDLGSMRPKVYETKLELVKEIGVELINSYK